MHIRGTVARALEYVSSLVCTCVWRPRLASLAFLCYVRISFWDTEPEAHRWLGLLASAALESIFVQVMGSHWSAWLFLGAAICPRAVHPAFSPLSHFSSPRTFSSFIPEILSPFNNLFTFLLPDWQPTFYFLSLWSSACFVQCSRIPEAELLIYLFNF